MIETEEDRTSTWFLVVLMLFFLSGIGMLAGFLPVASFVTGIMPTGTFVFLFLVSGIIVVYMAGFREHNIILTGIVAGLILGVLAGWKFGSGASSFTRLGDLFLNGLNMVIIPLVIASIIVGVTGLGDVRRLGKVGTGTIYTMLLPRP